MVRIFIILAFFKMLYSCAPHSENNVVSEKSIPLIDLSKEKRQFTYINLARSPERDQMMKAQLDLAKVNFTRFDAIEGKHVNVQKLVDDGLYDANTRDYHPLSNGEIGVYLSNIQILDSWQKSQPKGVSFILEDDTVIPQDLDQELTMALRTVPKDWDMLYLGCYLNINVDPNQNWLVQSPYRKEGQLHNACSSASLEPIVGSAWQKMSKTCVAGAFAYAVNSGSLSFVLDKIKPMKKAIDLIYAELYGNDILNAYCLNPNLIRTSYSTNSTIR